MNRMKTFTNLLLAALCAVLLIHGDSHAWLQDRPFATATNLTRIMVPGERDVRAAVVTVDPEAVDPWSFRLVGAADRVRNDPC